MKEQSQHKIEARFGLSMLKNPILFDHIDGFEFFFILWVQILSYLPLLKEGTAAELPDNFLPHRNFSTTANL